MIDDNIIKQLNLDFPNSFNPDYDLIIAIIERAIKDSLSRTKHPIFGNSMGAVSAVISNRAYVWLMSDDTKEFSLRWYLQNVPIDSESFVKNMRILINENYKEKNDYSNFRQDTNIS